MEYNPPIVKVHTTVCHVCARCQRLGSWERVRVHWIHGKITGSAMVFLCSDCRAESGSETTEPDA